MQLVHATGKTWYIVLYQHTMYVLSLSNISIKTNVKQITRVESKLTNLVTTLREITWWRAWRHVICYHSFTNTTLLFDHVHCRITLVRHRFFLRNMDLNGLKLPEILKLCPWKWEYDHEFAIHYINEWTLNSRFVYVDAFQWYDVMTK